MSKLETPMTRQYWKSVGGLLVEEFCLVRAGKDCSVRRVDAIILPDRETRIADPGEQVNVTGERVIVVQTKARRLGMYLMGQTLFSAELLRRHFSPASEEAVALCAKDDKVLRPLLEAHAGCQVVVVPSDGQDSARDGREEAPED
jgi:hypothetical protein